jgi:butyrate kinase
MKTMNKRLILIINPGSTSTKFALFEEDNLVFEKTFRHTSEELTGYARIVGQLEFRKKLIIKELEERKISFADIHAVIGRGGLIKPIDSGIYLVNDKMKADLNEGKYGEHASNLGALIADELCRSLPQAEAYIVDPVVVDELEPVARISGHPRIERKSIFHALNQKAAARAYGSSVGVEYEGLNLVVAHMGGGISVAAHKMGRVVDVNNAFNGDGPFSPERSGGLPAGQLADLCFNGEFTENEVKQMITGKGGMVAYLGTNSFEEICTLADKGDQKAKLIREAAAYQVGKEIGSMAAVLGGKVDAIILTGGMAYNKTFTNLITSIVSFIAKIVLSPGEDEMKALATSGLRALNKEIEIKVYC